MCTFHNEQYVPTVYNVHCPMYSIRCTLYIAHCILYTVHCTLYIVQYTLYNAHRHTHNTITHRVHVSLNQLSFGAMPTIEEDEMQRGNDNGYYQFPASLLIISIIAT